MKRKILSLILVFAMTVSLFTVGTGAVKPTYGDIAGHWAEDSIERWSGHGIIQGSNDLFDPNGQLTCAQLATILAKLLKLPVAKDAGFTDNKADAWYYDAINRCAGAGILNGNGDGTVGPNATISRERAIVMLARALGIEPIENPDLTKYADAAKVSAYAQGMVAAMIEAGIVGGVTADTLAPRDNINRASTVTILNRAIAVYADEDGETIDASKVNGLILIAAKNVTVKDAPKGTSVLVCKDASGATVNGKAVDAGTSVTAEKAQPAKPTTGGGSSGGSTPSPSNLTVAEAKTVSGGTYQNIAITDAVGDGEVTLSGLTIRGNLTVQGGGSSSVKLENCILGGKVIMDKASGQPPRLHLTNTPVKAVEVKRPAILESADAASAITAVTVQADTTVQGANTKIDKMNVPASAEQPVYLIVNDAEVTQINTNKAASIRGNGKVETVVAEAPVNVDSATVDKVEVPASAKDVVINVTGSTEIVIKADSGSTKIAADNTGKITVNGNAEGSITLHAHSWDEGVVTKQSTCSKEGVKTYTCTAEDCPAKTKTESIAKIPHTEVVDAAVAANCITAGKAEGKHCSVCSTVIVAQEEIKPLGHDFAADFTVDKAATCTEAGSKSKHCSRCDAKGDVTEIPATGHTFAAEWSKDADYHWHAATCGHDVVSEKTAHTWNSDTCSVCGTTKTEEASQNRVSNIHFEQKDDCFQLAWDAPLNANSLNNPRYNIYLQKNGSWIELSGTSQTLLSYPVDEAGDYTAVRIDTTVMNGRDRKILASCDQAVDFKVSFTKDTAPTLVTRSKNADLTNEWKMPAYDERVTGVTPNVWGELQYRTSNSSHSSGTLTGNGGVWTSTSGSDNMEECLAFGEYRFLEYLNVSVSNGGLAASYTVNQRGDWTACGDGTLSQTEKSLSTVTGYTLTKNGSDILLKVTQPTDKTGIDRYQIYLYTNEGRWVRCGQVGTEENASAVIVASGLEAGTYTKLAVLSAVEDGDATHDAASAVFECSIAVTKQSLSGVSASFAKTGDDAIRATITGVAEGNADAYRLECSATKDMAGGFLSTYVNDDGTSGSFEADTYAYYRITCCDTNVVNGTTATMVFSSTEWQRIEVPSDTPADTKNGYDITWTVGSGALNARLTAPGVEDLSVKFTIYLYNAETGEHSSYGNCRGDGKFDLPLDVTTGEYDRVRVYRTISGNDYSEATSLADWALEKKVIASENKIKFPHNAGTITVTVQENEGSGAPYKYTFTGLDFTKYSYILTNPSANSSLTLTAKIAYGAETWIGTGMTLAARTVEETPKAYTIFTSESYSIDIAQPDNKTSLLPSNIKLGRSDAGGLTLQMAKSAAADKIKEMYSLHYEIACNDQTNTYDRSLNPATASTDFITDYSKLFAGANTVKVTFKATPTDEAKTAGYVEESITFTATVNYTVENETGYDKSVAACITTPAEGQKTLTVTRLKANQGYRIAAQVGEGGTVIYRDGVTNGEGTFTSTWYTPDTFDCCTISEWTVSDVTDTTASIVCTPYSETISITAG